MLSRVAHSLYWLSRYMERAENTARILDVNLQLFDDFEAYVDNVEPAFWSAIVETTGGMDLFHEHFDQVEASQVTSYLTWDALNPNSILSSVNSARENARMIRDQISQELWECINHMYHFVRNARDNLDDEASTFAFFEEIKGYSYRFVGLMDATCLFDGGYKFHQVGRYLERADQTSRILDLKYFLPVPANQPQGAGIDHASWAAILRSCSGVDAFQRLHPAAEVEERKVAEFLIFARDFPRSIRFSLWQLERHLRSISGADEGHYANRAEKRVGRVLSEVAYKGIEDIIEEGLHEFIDRLQRGLHQINDAVFETYFELPLMDMEEEIAFQHSQQQ